MTGYAGNHDLGAEQAMIMAENGVFACRETLVGTIHTHCLECGCEIDLKRIQTCLKNNMKCEYCVPCMNDIGKQPKPKIKMLTYIL